MTKEQKRELFTQLATLEGISTGREYAESLSTEPMQVGDRVAWTIDGEPGTVVGLNDSAIAIEWEFSGTEWYSF
jgi:hypothetical protein